MPRICNREGCGKRIVAKDGSPDYRKHFCGSACLKIDKRERVQAKRARVENGRCPHCGRKPTLAVIPAVSGGASRVRDASLDSCVKLQHDHRRASTDAVEESAEGTRSKGFGGFRRGSRHLQILTLGSPK